MTQSRKDVEKTKDSKSLPRKTALGILGLPPEVLGSSMSMFLTKPDVLNLTLTSKRAYSSFQETRRARNLFQAIVDHDVVMFASIINSDPKLNFIDIFSADPKTLGITSIESKMTGVRFVLQPMCIMAKELNCIGIIDQMLTLVEAAKKKDAKDHKSSSQLEWGCWPSNNQLTNSNLQAQYIRDYFTPLAQTIIVEPLNDDTENALMQFRKILLPDHPVDIDKYVNPIQLLIAAYKAYQQHFYSFNSADKQEVFAVQVIGFVQSILPPELGEFFYGEKLPYRSKPRNFDEGLGFDTLCSVYGGRGNDGEMVHNESNEAIQKLEALVEIIDNFFKVKTPNNTQATQEHADEKSYIPRPNPGK